MTHLHIIDDDMPPPFDPADPRRISHDHRDFGDTDHAILTQIKADRGKPPEDRAVRQGEFQRFEGEVTRRMQDISANLAEIAKIIKVMAEVQAQMLDLQRVDKELGAKITALEMQHARHAEAMARALERIEAEAAEKIRQHTGPGKQAAASLERWRNRLWIVGVAAPVAGSIAVAVGTDWVKGLISR